LWRLKKYRIFGFCLLINSEFVSVCNKGYVGGGYAELDIMTKSEYRRQGLDVITCKAFIEHSIHNMLIFYGGMKIRRLLKVT